MALLTEWINTYTTARANLQQDTTNLRNQATAIHHTIAQAFGCNLDMVPLRSGTIDKRTQTMVLNFAVVITEKVTFPLTVELRPDGEKYLGEVKLGSERLGEFIWGDTADRTLDFVLHDARDQIRSWIKHEGVFLGPGGDTESVTPKALGMVPL